MYQELDSSPTSCSGRSPEPWSTRSDPEHLGQGGTGGTSCRWTWRGTHTELRRSSRRSCEQLQTHKKYYLIFFFLIFYIFIYYLHLFKKESNIKTFHECEGGVFDNELKPKSYLKTSSFNSFSGHNVLADRCFYSVPRFSSVPSKTLFSCLRKLTVSVFLSYL